MSFNPVKKIAYLQAFKAITAGLIIAYIIMALMAGPAWLFEFDYAGTVLFSATMTYLSCYFWGGWTGIWIAKQRRFALLLGITAGFLIVWTATFLGSLIGFFEEGLSNNGGVSQAAYDYIYKPIAMVSVYGLLPIILIGIWFGFSIRKKMARFQKE